MNAKPKAEEIANAEPLTGLALLRAPFAAHHISKLPKPTKAQTQAVKDDFKKGIRCKLCGSWHHPDVVHLDYVGHAALTDRLLDVDPAWSWEPVAFDAGGLPAFDKTGGLWIRLTVCGVTRLGYGHADVKPGQDSGAREKETIGDALRNAAMRFGAALDLWHKGDLHAEEAEAAPAGPSAEETAINVLRGASADADLFRETWGKNKAAWRDLLDDAAYGRVVAEMKRLGAEIAKRQQAEEAEREAEAFRGGGQSRVAGNGRDNPFAEESADHEFNQSVGSY